MRTKIYFRYNRFIDMVDTGITDNVLINENIQK